MKKHRIPTKRFIEVGFKRVLYFKHVNSITTITQDNDLLLEVKTSVYLKNGNYYDLENMINSKEFLKKLEI